MRKYICLFLYTFMCFAAINANAQTDTCLAHLKDASNNYDQGNYDDAIAVLNNTLAHCSLENSDQIQARKMLILCYIAIDNLEAANKVAGQIMKINPNYKPDKFKDDSRLISMFSKFRPEPTFAIGISSGINMPVEKTVHPYSIFYQNGQAPEKYKPNKGYQLNAQAERKAYRNFWVELGFSYRSTTYQHNLYNVDSLTINYSEKLTYIDIPLSLKYYFRVHHSLTPYVQAGAYFSFLSKALSTTSANSDEDIINRTALRNAYETGYFGGIGISYKVKSFLFSLNMRYILYPEDVNKAGTRYDDPINLYKYYYIDDDFKLDNVQVNVGASFILAYKNINVGDKIRELEEKVKEKRAMSNE